MKEIKSITNVQWTFHEDGIHPILEMSIDGRIAELSYVQKLLDSHGFVFLGPDFYDDFYADWE